ncbi:MAG: SPFH domain-containing protein [Gemmatimonadales bacterium]|nr:SPFH domain-containing protein [Gemmatimonadales bacterium]
MGSLVLGIVLGIVALILFTTSAGLRSGQAKPGAGARITRLAAWLVATLAVFLVGTAGLVVIDAGTVGVAHAFGTVQAEPLLPGVRFVAPWSSVERYSTREEQWPEVSGETEDIPALSNEQMSMKVDVAVRWQIDAKDAPRIYTEIGSEEQIKSVVQNAIRKGVRDGMVAFSINDISQRTKIAETMRALTDSALVTRPREGGTAFRIASLSAFFLRNLEPPQQVVQAINNKIAQEQQVATERFKVDVARLQSDQQRLLNQTLTAEALTKQYLEVLHDMKGSNNLIVLVPTEGGVPMLDIAKLRGNLRE